VAHRGSLSRCRRGKRHGAEQDRVTASKHRGAGDVDNSGSTVNTLAAPFEKSARVEPQRPLVNDWIRVGDDVLRERSLPRENDSKHLQPDSNGPQQCSVGTLDCASVLAIWQERLG